MCFVAYYRMLKSLHSAVGIVIRLWVGSLRYCVSIPDRSTIFFYSPKGPDWLWDPTTLLFNGY